MRRLIVVSGFGLVGLYLLLLGWLVLTILTSKNWGAVAALFLSPFVIVCGIFALLAVIKARKGDYSTASIMYFTLAAILVWAYVIPALPNLALGWLAHREARKQAGYISAPGTSSGYKFRQSFTNKPDNSLLLYFSYGLVVLYVLYYGTAWFLAYNKADWEVLDAWLLSIWLLIPLGLAIWAVIETLREKYLLAGLLQFLTAAFYFALLIGGAGSLYNSDDLSNFFLLLPALPHTLAAVIAHLVALRGTGKAVVSLRKRFWQSLKPNHEFGWALYFSYTLIILYPLFYLLIWLFAEHDGTWGKFGMLLLLVCMILPTLLAIVAIVDELQGRFQWGGIAHFIAIPFYLLLYSFMFMNSYDYPTIKFIWLIPLLLHVIAGWLAGSTRTGHQPRNISFR